MGRGRTLAEFQREFPDEARCDAFLSARRWRDGFVCPACGGGRAVALKSRPRLLECLDCGRQTSLTAGTAMHRSKLPLTTWFWAAHVMATHSNGMSARQLEDQLGVTYKTAWCEWCFKISDNLAPYGRRREGRRLRVCYDCSQLDAKETARALRLIPLTQVSLDVVPEAGRA